MTDARKFYVTELTIRVLAEDAPWDGNLEWLSHDVTKGDYAGHIAVAVNIELTEAEMAEALVNAGNDPEFFAIKAKESGRNKQTIVVTAEGQEWA